MKAKTNRNLKRTITCSLVTTMMLTGTAYAETVGGMVNSGAGANAGAAAFVQTSASLRQGFPDVASDHWAIKHISKLALLGIVQGDDLGKYNPESTVSQQDVVIMAIRMMGLENEALANTKTIALPLIVREDAKPYIAKAVEKGLIDLQEEASAGANWGNRGASREWVAKMVVRAIGKTEEALQKANDLGTFRDYDKISADARGYINAAVSLGLVNGFEDGTFRPQETVTRAQMATFMSRAEKYLSKLSDRVVTGFVASIDGAKLTLETKDGQSRQLQLHTNAAFYTYKDDSAKLVPSAIQPFNEVYVIQDQGIAYYVELASDEIPMQLLEGTLVDVNIDDLTVTLQADGKNTTYDLSANVSILDANGGGLSLSGLVKESDVVLKRNSRIKDAKVSQIVVKRVPINKTLEGTLQSVDLQAMTITVTDKTTGTAETYPLTDKSIFRLNDRYFDPANLYEGDIVRVEVKNSKAVSVVVVDQLIDLREEGKIKMVSDDLTYLTLQKSGDKLAAYAFAPNVRVVIEGNNFASVKDLLPGDEVKLEINDDKIDKITVTARNNPNIGLYTVETYVADSKILVLKDEKGNLASYVITDRTRLLYDSSELPGQSFATYLTKGKRVSLVVSPQGQLVSVQINTRAEGTVAYVNPVSAEITLRTPNGQYQTYRYYAGVYVEKRSVSGAKITDVMPGDYIRASLDASQEQIMSIAVRDTVVYRTAAKDAINKQITVKEHDMASSVYSLANIPIIRNGLTASLADIPTDEPIELTFIGHTLEGVRIVEAIRGAVNAVDQTGGKLTITDYSNASRVINVGTSFLVRNGSNVYPSLAYVNVNDRVEIVKDSTGKTHLTVLAGQMRTFDSYNAVTKEMTFKRRTLYDQTTYPLHDRVYVHQGANVLSPGSLAANDVVTIYLINDKIVEVSK